MTDKKVLSEKELPEKAAAMARFEYSPLSKELKNQTSASEKQHQFDMSLIFDFENPNI